MPRRSFPPDTIESHLARIETLEELEGFATMLRAPPPGITPKPCTPEQWRKIAARKIQFQEATHDRR